MKQEDFTDAKRSESDQRRSRRSTLVRGQVYLLLQIRCFHYFIDKNKKKKSGA